jgi:hypothetical protein
MISGFNKRKEILRELKLALENNQKKYFFKHESLGKQDLAVEIDDKTIDLSKYEYLPFSNEMELLRKVVALLLGKIGQKETLFMMRQGGL